MKLTWTKIKNANAFVPFLAIVASFIVGGVLIAFSNADALAALEKGDVGGFFSYSGWGIVNAYDALFRGSVFNYQAPELARMFKPITETLTFATPLTLAGLALAVSFRSGLFNIGAPGQIIFGAMFSAWWGINVDLPIWVNLPLAILLGIIGGALFGGLVGFLKATTGANEVILTIMLNYVASLLLAYLLKTPLFQAPHTIEAISLPIKDSARYPMLLGDQFRIHLGFIMMLAAVWFVHWLLERSSIGFKFRALGHNARAAKVAGINIGVTYVAVMAVSGALAGIAGTTQILGTESVLTPGVAGSYGIDAITVALLGRNNPWGVLAAGILFGGLRAGAVNMQSSAGVPVDIVLVVQSMIVLFIAAPPLIKSIFRIGKEVPVEAK